MLKLSSLAAALMLVLSSGAFASSAQQGPAQQGGGWSKPAPLSGPAKRAAVISNLAGKGLSKNVRVVGVGQTPSGKSSRVLVANTNSGAVQGMIVRNKTGVAYGQKPANVIKQSTAAGIANLNLRREQNQAGNKGGAGTFSGVNKSGLSNSGKSFEFNSATDRTEGSYVNVKTGAEKTVESGTGK